MAIEGADSTLTACVRRIFELFTASLSDLFTASFFWIFTAAGQDHPNEQALGGR
jgi:hypothetical protein